MAEAFRTFALDPPYAVQTLRKQLIERQADLTMQLAGGYAKDWGDCCRRVGEIAGLTTAIAICDDMQKQQEK